MKLKHMLVFTFALLLAAYVSRGRAGEIAKPTVNLSIYGRVSSVGWITKDLDPVLNYWENLGLKDVQRRKVTELTGLTYRGKPTPTTAKTAFGHVGDTFIEWIQPVTGTTVYTEFLKRHGDGILALGYAVDSEKQLQQQIQYFQSKGVEVVQRTERKEPNGTDHAAYFDTSAKGGGVDIMVYYDPAGSTPSEAGAEANDYPMTKFTHYGFVVSNVRKVADYWQDLGFGGMQINHNISVDRFYRGQPTKFEMDIGWQRYGDPPFEWIQSTVGPNHYEEYFRNHREGLHHIGVPVNDMDAAVKMMKSKGAPSAMWGGWDTLQSKGRFAYLDTDPHGGVTLELIWNQRMPTRHGGD